MKLDYRFAETTLKADGTPDYAPAILRVVTHHHEEGVDPETGEPWSRDWDTYETKLHPTAADYAQMEYVPVVTAYPAEPASEGKHWEASGWEADSAFVRRTYAEVDNPPPPPRLFSKLKLYAALTQAGLWDALEAWLKAQFVEGVNAYTAFSLAQELSEAHPLFASWYAQAKQVLGVTDEQAEAILAASVQGGA